MRLYYIDVFRIDLEKETSYPSDFSDGIDYQYLFFDKRWMKVWAKYAFFMRDVHDMQEGLYEIGRLFKANGIVPDGIYADYVDYNYTRECFPTRKCEICNGIIKSDGGRYMYTANGEICCAICADKMPDEARVCVGSEMGDMLFIMMDDETVNSLREKPNEYIGGSVEPPCRIIENYIDDIAMRKG